MQVAVAETDCSTAKSVVVCVVWLAEFVACSLVADVATVAMQVAVAAMQVVMQVAALLLLADATSLLTM
jgi:hypothetical protein